MAHRGAQGEADRSDGPDGDEHSRSKPDDAGPDLTKELLDLAVETTGGATCIIDLRTGRVEASDGLAELFGFSSSEPPTSIEQLRERLHPSEVKRMADSARQAIKQHTEFADTHRVVWPDGSVHWLIGRIRFLYDDDGHATLLYGYVFSADQRQAIEAELVQAEARLIRTQRDGQLGTWEIDVATGVTTLSPEFAKMLGVSGRKYEMDEVLPSIDEASRSVVAAQYEHVARHGGTYESEHRLVSLDAGQVRWVHARGEAVRDSSGQIVKIVGTTRDITEHRERLDSFERTSQLLSLLQESTHDVVFQTDADGRTILANEAGWHHLTGRPAGSWQGEGWLEAVHPNDRAATRLEYRRSIELGEAFDTELRFMHVDGSERWALSRMVPMLDDENRLTGYVGRTTDITALKAAENDRNQLQATLAQAQRLDAIGTLASGVAHDINNALAVVRLSLELAGAGQSDTDNRAHFDRTKLAIEQAESVTAQLLTFARQANKAKVPTDLRALVTETVGLLEKLISHAVTIEIDLGAREVWVLGDPVQLRQALTNLIINASDAMPDGGPLRVEVDLTAGTTPQASLRVIDGGTGMSEEHLARVFEPFFTTKPVGQGTGLGLAVTHGIIGAHHGTIEVESDLGRGTTVTCRLPGIRPQSSTPIDLTEPSPSRGHRELILVADDNAPLRDAIVIGLEGAGYRVAFTGDGSGLLDLIVDSDPPALAILDVDLPGRNGVQCARVLRDRSPELPVIFITGSPEHHDLEVTGPNDDVVGKPFALSDLLHRVADRIASDRSPASHLG